MYLTGERKKKKDKGKRKGKESTTSETLWHIESLRCHKTSPETLSYDQAAKQLPQISSRRLLSLEL